MKHMKFFLTSLLAVALLFSACKKEDAGSGPQKPGNNNPPPNKPDTGYIVKVKAVIGIGDIVYDSLPASLQIISWDSNNVVHQKQIELAAGANSIALSKAHVKYQLKLSKWGIADEMTFTRGQIPEGTTIGLGGTRAAKKLSLEESFLFAAGAYQPDSKSIYTYNTNGTLKQVDYYQKKPQHSDLKLYHSDVFVYTGNRVRRINRLDEHGTTVGRTEFSYSAEGKITNIYRNSYGQETGAAVEYNYGTGYAFISFSYLFDNGNTMTYKMKIKGGNKVEDAARSSTGGSEGGTYGYDFNINPFAHMNIPNLYLSNLSRNNLNSQQKYYSGSIPSAEPYGFDYTYDAEGYPKEVVKSYKSYRTGEHLYKIKTVYSY